MAKNIIVCMICYFKDGLKENEVKIRLLFVATIVFY